MKNMIFIYFSTVKMVEIILIRGVHAFFPFADDVIKIFLYCMYCICTYG